MKFYETHFEEYVEATENFNLHEELISKTQNIQMFKEELFERNVFLKKNIIVYGPKGVGKYSQVLLLLKKHSPSSLKYEKKVTVSIDKQTYVYRISDIHFEIDMELLGCNSKILFYEIFVQIVDIVSVRKEKKGIIVCKNFHYIHNELLEIFYSYMQNIFQPYINIQLHFILITEHVSFFPNKILQNCEIISVSKPCKDKIINMCISNNHFLTTTSSSNEDNESFCSQTFVNNIDNFLQKIDFENIVNNKEIYSFSKLKEIKDLPPDNFNTICDNIIQEILHIVLSSSSSHFKTSENNNNNNISLIYFREILYEILVYNLDVMECVWYVLYSFIKKKMLDENNILHIFKEMYLSLKRLNNNYRSIFHIEFIFLMIVSETMKHKNNSILLPSLLTPNTPIIKK